MEVHQANNEQKETETPNLPREMHLFNWVFWVEHLRCLAMSKSYVWKIDEFPSLYTTCNFSSQATVSGKWNYCLDLAWPANFTWRDQIFDVAISSMLDPLEVSLLRDTEVGASICKAPAHSNVFTTRNEPDFPYQLLLHKPSGNYINIKIPETNWGFFFQGKDFLTKKTIF